MPLDWTKRKLKRTLMTPCTHWRDKECLAFHSFSTKIPTGIFRHRGGTRRQRRGDPPPLPVIPKQKGSSMDSVYLPARIGAAALTTHRRHRQTDRFPLRCRRRCLGGWNRRMPWRQSHHPDGMIPQTTKKRPTYLGTPCPTHGRKIHGDRIRTPIRTLVVPNQRL